MNDRGLSDTSSHLYVSLCSGDTLTFFYSFNFFLTAELRDLPTVMYVPVLHPCMASERLCVSVNVQTGNFLVSLNGKGNLV